MNHESYRKSVRKLCTYANCLPILLSPSSFALVSFIPANRAEKLSRIRRYFSLEFAAAFESAKTATKPANNESPLALSARTDTRTPTQSHPDTHGGTRSVERGGPRRREGGGGVCYRYRATWPRGDRDNASPPLLSARRFACFDPVSTYLPTYVTPRSYSPTPPTPTPPPTRPRPSIPARSTSPDRLSYFCATSRHAAFTKPKNCARKEITGA